MQEQEIKPKNKKRLITVVVFLFVVFAAIGIANTPKSEQVSEQPSENTSDLNLSINPKTLSIKLVNNEDKILTDCEVQINPGLTNAGYTTRIDLPVKKSVDIPYSILLKGDERFDNSNNAVTSVVVTHCKDQPDRVGIYSK